MFKRVAIAAWTLLAIVLAVLLLSYYSNHNAIQRYNHGHYEQNQLGFLGVTQPYVNHFNRGNVYYQLEDYDRAITEYKQALISQPDETYDCRIRVNYALALVTPLDLENLEEDDIDEILEILDEARTILMENGCADDENTGHYRPAQILKNEIDELEQALTNGGGGSSDPTPTPTPPDGETPSPTPTPQGGTTTPSPTPQGEGEGTPTPTPQGEGEGTPTPTPGEGEGTPTPTPQGEGTPTPTPGGEGEGTPTPTPGGGGGNNPTPTVSPEDQLRDIMNQGLQERSSTGDIWTDEWNFGDYATW
ncbi:MAG: tetratricopeptide repeat protein [Saccharofermentans sp.]|nr:tetratricopeptide repeat protein [Saccharofermentans sp.]